MKKIRPIYIVIILLFVITSCENKVSDNPDLLNLEKRVILLENQFSNLQSQEFRKIIIDQMNIRKQPSKSSDIVAKAGKNSYLRVLNTENEWLLVEFYIDDFPFIGYITTNEEYSQKELLPINSQISINKRGLVKILWEDQVKKELDKITCDLLGVYIYAPNSTIESQLRNHLVNYFREYDIYFKPLQTFSEKNITQICNDESICSIISLNVDNSSSNENIHIQLFGSNEIIYYSTSLPIDGKLFE